jgi:hypothetical protein
MGTSFPHWKNLNHGGKWGAGRGMEEVVNKLRPVALESRSRRYIQAASLLSAKGVTAAMPEVASSALSLERAVRESALIKRRASITMIRCSTMTEPQKKQHL